PGRTLRLRRIGRRTERRSQVRRRECHDPLPEGGRGIVLGYRKAELGGDLLQRLLLAGAVRAGSQVSLEQLALRPIEGVEGEGRGELGGLFAGHSSTAPASATSAT